MLLPGFFIARSRSDPPNPVSETIFGTTMISGTMIIPGSANSHDDIPFRPER